MYIIKPALFEIVNNTLRANNASYDVKISSRDETTDVAEINVMKLDFNTSNMYDLFDLVCKNIDANVENRIITISLNDVILAQTNDWHEFCYEISLKNSLLRTKGELVDTMLKH